ncbi:MAG TPA: hypothetical protein VFZ29_00090 [Solirubrobacterales bacterium]
MKAIDSPRENIFRKLAAPPSRAAEVLPVCNVLPEWRAAAPLEPSFDATKLGWVVDVFLGRGVELSTPDGMAPWQAEREYQGLLHHEPKTVDTASWLLDDSWGVVMPLPGSARALLVADEHFDEAIDIRGAVWYSEHGEPISLLETPEKEQQSLA